MSNYPHIDEMEKRALRFKNIKKLIVEGGAEIVLKDKRLFWLLNQWVVFKDSKPIISTDEFDEAVKELRND